MNVFNRALIAVLVGFWSVWLFNNINPWLGIGLFVAYVYFVAKKVLKEGL